MPNHAIVIGGTGMLKEATLWLEETGYHVSVIARTRTKLEKVKEQAIDPTKVSVYSVDYHDEGNFVDIIKRAIDENGPVNLVVAWIHSSAPCAFQELVQTIDKKQDNQWELYCVKGSTKKIPSDLPELPERCHYHQIFLGFVIENNWSRWLTNHEISNGAIQAIKENQAIHIVGTLEPWGMRP